MTDLVPEISRKMGLRRVEQGFSSFFAKKTFFGWYLVPDRLLYMYLIFPLFCCINIFFVKSWAGKIVEHIGIRARLWDAQQNAMPTISKNDFFHTKYQNVVTQHINVRKITKHKKTKVTVCSSLLQFRMYAIHLGHPVMYKIYIYLDFFGCPKIRNFAPKLELRQKLNDWLHSNESKKWKFRNTNWTYVP